MKRNAKEIEENKQNRWDLDSGSEETHGWYSCRTPDTFATFQNDYHCPGNRCRGTRYTAWYLHRTSTVSRSTCNRRLSLVAYIRFLKCSLAHSKQNWNVCEKKKKEENIVADWWFYRRYIRKRRIETYELLDSKHHVQWNTGELKGNRRLGNISVGLRWPLLMHFHEHIELK